MSSRKIPIFAKSFALAVLLFDGHAVAQNPPPTVNCSNSVGGNNSGDMHNDCGNTYLGPPRIANGLYQNGERIGVVEAIVAIDELGKKVTFRNIRISGSAMNLRAPIEIRNALVSCPAFFDMTTGAVQTTIMMAGETVCDIVGKRQ
jgi:hypothetical protein